MSGGNPVVIGGLGGSGTRLVAELVQGLGIHLGPDVNEAHDNLWFTLLLKRPRWLDSASDAEFDTAFEILAGAMTGTLRPRLRHLRVLSGAIIDLARSGHGYPPAFEPRWPVARAVRLLWWGHKRRAPHRWGWKEPNSHVVLDRLARALPGVVYIHVLRHGLDMAFSENQTQLQTWGGRFGVAVPADRELLPRAALEYWIRANSAAIACGQAALGERFAAFTLESLCEQPPAELERLAALLQVTPSRTELDRLASIPRRPASVGRYKERDLNAFTDDQLRAVERMGFSI